MRITSFEQASIANKEVSNRVADLRKRVETVDSDLRALIHKYTSTLDTQRSLQTTHNTVFTWNGGTGALTWNDSNIQDSLEKTHTIPAGSLTLSPSTYYWMVWNKTHQKMIAVPGVELKIFTNPENNVLCQVFTGTVGQSGVAGGGGSTSTRDLSGGRYKNF